MSQQPNEYEYRYYSPQTNQQQQQQQHQQQQQPQQPQQPPQMPSASMQHTQDNTYMNYNTPQGNQQQPSQYSMDYQYSNQWKTVPSVPSQQPATPQLQQPLSHHNITQPSPQYHQQHSGGPFSAGQPPTPQQQLAVPQRSVDNRFTSPASVQHKSPAYNQQLQQPMSHSSTQPPSSANRSQSQASQGITTRPFPVDPIQANKILVLRELRKAISEVTSKAEFLLSSHFSEERGATPAASYQPWSVSPLPPGTPNTTTATVKTKAPPTEEEIKAGRERYLNAVSQFLTVTDDLERNLATIVEANKEYQKYDTLSTTKVPQDIQNFPYVELMQQRLETAEEDRKFTQKTLAQMDDLLLSVKRAEKTESSSNMDYC